MTAVQASFSRTRGTSSAGGSSIDAAATGSFAASWATRAWTACLARSLRSVCRCSATSCARDTNSAAMSSSMLLSVATCSSRKSVNRVRCGSSVAATGAVVSIPSSVCCCAENCGAGAANPGYSVQSCETLGVNARGGSRRPRACCANRGTRSSTASRSSLLRAVGPLMNCTRLGICDLRRRDGVLRPSCARHQRSEVGPLTLELRLASCSGNAQYAIRRVVTGGAEFFLISYLP